LPELHGFRRAAALCALELGGLPPKRKGRRKKLDRKALPAATVRGVWRRSNEEPKGGGADGDGEGRIKERGVEGREVRRHDTFFELGGVLAAGGVDVDWKRVRRGLQADLSEACVKRLSVAGVAAVWGRRQGLRDWVEVTPNRIP